MTSNPPTEPQGKADAPATHGVTGVASAPPTAASARPARLRLDEAVEVSDQFMEAAAKLAAHAPGQRLHRRYAGGSDWCFVVKARSGGHGSMGIAWIRKAWVRATLIAPLLNPSPRMPEEMRERFMRPECEYAGWLGVRGGLQQEGVCPIHAEVLENALSFLSPSRMTALQASVEVSDCGILYKSRGNRPQTEVRHCQDPVSHRVTHSLLSRGKGGQSIAFVREARLNAQQPCPFRIVDATGRDITPPAPEGWSDPATPGETRSEQDSSGDSP